MRRIAHRDPLRLVFLICPQDTHSNLRASAILAGSMAGSMRTYGNDKDIDVL